MTVPVHLTGVFCPERSRRSNRHDRPTVHLFALSLVCLICLSCFLVLTGHCSAAHDMDVAVSDGGHESAGLVEDIAQGHKTRSGLDESTSTTSRQRRQAKYGRVRFSVMSWQSSERPPRSAAVKRGRKFLMDVVPLAAVLAICVALRFFRSRENLEAYVAETAATVQEWTRRPFRWRDAPEPTSRAEGTEEEDADTAARSRLREQAQDHVRPVRTGLDARGVPMVPRLPPTYEETMRGSAWNRVPGLQVWDRPPEYTDGGAPGSG
ncbi:putative transmembrane protein [Toxoplasma gondii FOU]|uniref:Putative transmembrane protein n=3 Tax=Toxoplasma gondii TaxID=5811 RepID=A0A086KID1_TOXGO|nr:putative transmembrane protein [Toxoplasma gondii FOU]PUA84919.1 putative transmembrane protein [Toxoplasma gondii TgCATBr9]RQX70090.1 putative transmembrane protein [Toxoplasma gondii CAST]